MVSSTQEEEKSAGGGIGLMDLLGRSPMRRPLHHCGALKQALFIIEKLPMAHNLLALKIST